MLTDKERNEIDPEFCCRHLLGISSRLTNELSRDEQAAIFGAVSLIKDQSVDEWCFGIKQRRNWTTDKEKVINALERCESYGYCKDNDCPYYENTHCLELLRKDALKLLKGQEPRVLTRDEIIGYSGYIWKEYKGISCMNVVEIRNGMELMPYETPYPTKALSWKGYCKEWRCWSAQPTEEQRKAAKWDE